MSNDMADKYRAWEDGLHEKLQDLPARMAHIEVTAKGIAEDYPGLNQPSSEDARYGYYLSATAVKAACVMVAFPYSGKRKMEEEELEAVAEELLHQYKSWTAGKN